MSIKDTVRNAGITVDELAHLAGVSRTTASKWINGRSAPHYLIQDRVEAMLARLHARIISKHLPLPGESMNDRIMVHAPRVSKTGKSKRQAAYVRKALLDLLE